MLFNFYKYNKKYLIKNKFYYGTIFKTPALLHIAPDGSPADDVGIFFIDNLLTNVVQAISAVMFEPIMNDVVPVDDIVFPLPAKIALNEAFTVLPLPPPINDLAPLDTFKIPPATVDWYPLEVLQRPPPTVD